jgi:hypothetical protein
MTLQPAQILPPGAACAGKRSSLQIHHVSWYAATLDSKNSLPRRQGVSGLNQWKLSPQAHEPVALGLSMVKPCFSMVSTKSMVAPIR